MTDLTERFEAADFLDVDDVWPDVRDRVAGVDSDLAPVRRLPTNTQVSRGSNPLRRGLTAAAALLIFVASVAWILAVRGPEGRQSGSEHHPGLFDDVHGWLTYASDGSIYAIDPNGGTGGDGGPTLLVRPMADGVVPLAWAPDGSTLLFASITRGGHDAASDPEAIDLYLLDNAGEQTLVARGLDELWGSISPDGTVVYRELVSADPAVSRIMRMDPVTGERSVVSQSAAGADETPTVSPDGTSIAMFHLDDRDGAVSIDLMRSDGSARRRIVATDSLPPVWDVSGVAWSPDGNELVFGLATSPNKVLQVWVVHADGSGLHKIAEDALYPSWAPDAAAISFSRGDGTLATMDPDGGSVRERGTLVRGVLGDWSGRAGPWNPVLNGS